MGGVPHTIDWPGELSWDTTMSCSSATTSATGPTPAAKAAKSRSGSSTADRSTTSRRSSAWAGGMMPDATEPLHSPMLWPATRSGASPMRSATVPRKLPVR